MTSTTSWADGHVSEDRLVDLALGEQPVDEEDRHLADCSACRASFDALQRTVAVTRDAPREALVAPPDRVWEAIEARLADDVDGVDTDEGDVAESPRPGPTAGSRPSGQHRSWTWLVAACAAGVVAGGVGGAVVTDRVNEPEPARTIAAADLDTLDTGERLGSASVQESDDQVSLDVAASDIDASGGYAEVWLINRDGERMVSVGVLEESSGAGSFTISRNLLDEGYVVVDISREEFDDDPTHSGDSFVRGSLEDEA